MLVALTASAGKSVGYKHSWSFIVKLCNSPSTLSSEMSQTGMPGPCYCIFLGPVFFISPQWDFWGSLQDEVLVTEWGDPLGLSHTERVPLSSERQRELQEVKPPEWMGHKQHVELQKSDTYTHFYRCLTSLEPLFYSGGYTAGVRSPILTHSSKFSCWDQPEIRMWRISCITAASRPCCKCQAGWLRTFLRTEWVAGWFKWPFLHNWQRVSACSLDVEQLWHLSLLWAEAQHGLVSLHKRSQPYWLYALIWVTSE